MRLFGSTRAWRSPIILSFGVWYFACGDDGTSARNSDSGTSAGMDASVPPDGSDGSEQEAGALDSAATSQADAGDGMATEDASGPVAVEIELEARVGNEAFDCESTYEVGSGPSRVMPLDFRLYVHDVALLTAAGEQLVALEQDGAFQHEGVALLDFEDDSGTCSNGTSQTHTKIRGTVPAGDYTGLTFKIGVPEARNHNNKDEAPSPLNVEGMFWSWTTGYKFLRIDVQAMAPEADAGMETDAGPGHAGAPPGFNVHLGSTMCAGNAAAGEPVTCQRANRPEVRLMDFNATDDKIILDLAALVSGSDVAKNMGAQPGCMSGSADPECPAIFERLGLDLSTGASNATPSFLRVVEK